MTIQTTEQFKPNKLVKEAAALLPKLPEATPAAPEAVTVPVARPPLVPPQPAGLSRAASPTVETPATTTTATAEIDPIAAAEAADAEAMKDLAANIRAATADGDLAALERLLR